MLRFLILISFFLFSMSAYAAFPPGGMPPSLVEAITVKPEVWQQNGHATGTLTAIRGVILKPEITGKVTKILFTPGQLVKEGDPLIQLNPDILKAQLDSAKAQLLLSETNHQRMLSLHKKNVIAKADLDKSQATQDMDKAKLADAQARLDQSLIKAPFAGRIGLNKVNLGDYVAPGQELVSLQDIDPIRADFSVSESYAGKIALGQTVHVTTALHPGQIFIGKIAEMDAAIDTKTRTLAVRAHIPNPEQKLLPGGFVDVKFFFGQKQDVFLVPQTVVVFDASGNYVYKVVNKKAVKTLVKLDARMGDRVIVKEGLKAGDVVVIAGQVKLHDGASVDVKK